MRKLVPLFVFAFASVALAAGGRLPGVRKPVVCAALNASTVSIGYAGTLSGCSSSATKPCAAAEPIVFSAVLPATNSACGTESVTWNFGDGSTAAGAASTHIFTSMGIFTVTATIANARQTFSSSTPVTVAGPVPAPNRVVNGGFDTDISHWGFNDPTLVGGNGSGDASWSNLDAEGKPASGSIHLQNTANGRAFQQIQCVTLNPGEQYTFGARAYYDGNTTGGALLAVAEFGSSDCSGGSNGVLALPSVGVSFSGARKWVLAQTTTNAQPSTHSGYVFLAAGKSGTGTLYEVYFDDVFVRGAQ